MRTPIKTLFSIVALVLVLGLGAGAAFANCGVKDTHEGTLKSIDADANVVVVVDQEGEEVRLTLTDKTRVRDSEGNDAEASTLVGTKVRVVSEHAKIDSIEQIA